jgi:hypothetical protein
MSFLEKKNLSKVSGCSIKEIKTIAETENGVAGLKKAFSRALAMKIGIWNNECIPKGICSFFCKRKLPIKSKLEVDI